MKKRMEINKMNGRLEKEMKAEKAILEKLKYYPQVLTDFYYDMKDEGKSYTTAKCYINYVIHFVLFITGKTIKDNFYKNITSADIKRYMNSIKTKVNEDGEIVEMGDEIRATRWSAINNFFNFLKMNNYIDENPVDNTKRPKAKVERQVTYLNKEEIAAMLQKVKDEAKDMFVNRDLCILSLAIATGLRVNAICNININDINFNDNTISVIEKGHKRRKIPFGENIKEYIKAWQKDRKTYFGDADTDALFVSQFRQRLSTDMVRRMLKKYTEGITTKNITPHKLRASCAVAVYDQTKNILLVKDMLGHESVQTTTRYTRAAEEDKKEAVKFLDDLV
jgi:site-specific recombinase XerD